MLAVALLLSLVEAGALAATSSAPSNVTGLAAFLSSVQHHLLHNNQFSLVIAFTVLSLAAGLYTLRQSHCIQVTELWIFPVKGCAGISMRESRYDRLGLEFDRRWMLVRQTDDMHSFVVHEGKEADVDRAAMKTAAGIPTFWSQRQHPKMALLRTALDLQGERLILSAAGQEDLVIPFRPAASSLVLAVKLWDDVVLTSLYSEPAVTRWLTAFIGQPTVLVSVLHGDAQQHYRPIKAAYDTSQPQHSIHSAFSDGFPLLLASVQSLRDLQSRVPSRPISLLAFRPNVVVDGPAQLLPPWDEDRWESFTIGAQQFSGAKPCDRCAVPTTLLETGVRDPKYEPIQSMREFRALTTDAAGQPDGKVYFGMNCIQQKAAGSIRVGDRITVLSRRQLFMPLKLGPRSEQRS